MVDRSECTIIWTHCIWKILMINLHFPAVAIHRTVHQVNVGEFCPGETLHVNVDWLQYTHLWGSEFVLRNKQLSKLATRGMRKSWLVHCAHVSLCGFARFPTSVKPNLTVRKDASPTCSSLTVSLCFGHPYHLTKFGHWVFLHHVFQCTMLRFTVWFSYDVVL
jgi:hypothetical protein